ncbi:hypothetical protein ZTR_00084 [Talaromyces verruculosus]|nr:hypothetical protein ZTR_00084 [Talaromyces verruculosus]
MGLSAFYGKPYPDDERFKFLDHVYESGERFWDTSDIYGDSEDLLGRWFKQNPGKRDNIFLASKFGIVGPGAARSDPEYVSSACERSLARLGVSYIDLYYVHRVNFDVPIESTVQAMADLKKGKIRYLGLSEVSAATLRRAHSVHPISAVQMEYSPFSLDIEDPDRGFLATCRELGVAIVAYSPLGRGMLTGKYRSADDFEEGDYRKLAPRYFPDNFSKNLMLVDELRELATRKGCTVGQLTLAWLLALGDDIIPIPGTKNLKNFDENMVALAIQLPTGEVQEIRDLIDKAVIHGERYPSTSASLLFANTINL